MFRIKTPSTGSFITSLANPRYRCMECKKIAYDKSKCTRCGSNRLTVYHKIPQTRFVTPIEQVHQSSYDRKMAEIDNKYNEKMVRLYTKIINRLDKKLNEREEILSKEKFLELKFKLSEIRKLVNTHQFDSAERKLDELMKK